jgi:hypothetical protein
LQEYKRDVTKYQTLYLPLKNKGITFNEINKTVYCELYSDTVIEGTNAIINDETVLKPLYRSDNGSITIDVGLGKN